MPSPASISRRWIVSCPPRDALSRSPARSSIVELLALNTPPVDVYIWSPFSDPALKIKWSGWKMSSNSLPKIRHPRALGIRETRPEPPMNSVHRSNPLIAGVYMGPMLNINLNDTSETISLQERSSLVTLQTEACASFQEVEIVSSGNDRFHRHSSKASVARRIGCGRQLRSGNELRM